MIEIKNAVKKYKNVRAMDNLSLNVESGKITALLGINGVGKSTTIKAIMGLIKLDEGDILVDGEKVTHKTFDKIAMVPDIQTHYPNMTIKEAFEYMEVFCANWDKEKAYDMLEHFKLRDERKISDLSKGNMARVKIVLGFAQCPKYLLLDEPFSGMDIFTREAFLATMVRYTPDDMGILLTTHEIKEIEHIADEVFLMEEGKIVCAFNAEQVREEEGLSIVDKMREVYCNDN